MRLTHDQKETILQTIRELGTLKAGASAAGISMDALKEERRKSAVFRKRISEALQDGKQNLADKAIEKIQDYAFNPQGKTDRNVLTAAIALANAYEPGFRGSTTVQGKIEHDVRVITAVPRPKYIESPEVKVLDNPPKKMLKSGKKIIRDEQGNYIGTQTVEEAIEGEVIDRDSI